MTTYYMTPSMAPVVKAQETRPAETTSQKVDRWIREAFEANEAIGWDIVRWEWNDSFTARLGDADAQKGLIRLSTPLWARATEQERKQVVKHEACHLITRQRYGWAVSSHGPEWRATMRRCGLQPDRCHKVDRTDLVRRAPRYAVTCKCGANKSFAPTRFRRLLSGTQYRCKLCGSLIVKV